MHNRLRYVKNACRRTSNAFDDEILHSIRFVISELERVGISVPDGDDVRIDTCCELYYKGKINYDNSGEKYTKAFENLRDALSLSSDYSKKIRKE